MHKNDVRMAFTVPCTDYQEVVPINVDTKQQMAVHGGEVFGSRKGSGGRREKCTLSFASMMMGLGFLSTG